jgi:hypothetical protein
MVVVAFVGWKRVMRIRIWVASIASCNCNMLQFYFDSFPFLFPRLKGLLREDTEQMQCNAGERRAAYKAWFKHELSGDVA